MTNESYKAITGRDKEEYNMAQEMREHLKIKELERKRFNTTYAMIMEHYYETN